MTDSTTDNFTLGYFPSVTSSGGGGPATQIIETGGPTTLNISSIPDGTFLKRSGTLIIGATPAGSGTVTSVDMTVPSFLTVTGNPITTAGTLAVAYSGTALPIVNGGTGATSASAARTALGVAASGANSDITSLTGLTTPIPVAEGGTGATTAAGALTNLGAIGGTAATGRVAYGSGANTLTSSANFTFASGVPSNNFGALSHTEVWGATAGGALTTGATDNTFLGYAAGSGLTTSLQSTAFGSGSLTGSSTTGNNNNAFGYFALHGTVAGGGSNNAFGWKSGQAITSGSFNCMFGGESGQALTTGSANICIGDGAGFSLTTQSNSVCIGDDAGRLSTAVDGDIFIGYQAGRNQSGNFSKNTVVGYQAYLGSGTPASNQGNGNTIVGYQAGQNMTSGNSNNLFGGFTGQSLTTGGDNIYIGMSAGRYVTSGNDNVGLGSNACSGDGTTAPTGSNNFGLGYYALASLTTGSNNVAIGATAGGGFGVGITSGSNNILLGNAAGDSTANTANGHFVAGSAIGPITDLWLGGKGEAATSPPTAINYRTTSGSGTDIAGTNAVWIVGNGTGAGAGGFFSVQTAPAGTSGTAANTPVERIRVPAEGGLLMLGMASAPATLQNGQFWNDSVRKCLSFRFGGLTQTASNVGFTATADATVTNTTTETTVLGTGVGSLTLPANFLTVGKTIRISVRGIISNAVAATLRVRVFYGATALLDSTATGILGTNTNTFFMVSASFTCRTTGATGTVLPTGNLTYNNSTTSQANGLVVTGPVTIDTTTANALDIRVTWGTASASNSITGQMVIMEVLS